jgi:iron complex transport system substrate-binding protein
MQAHMLHAKPVPALALAMSLSIVPLPLAASPQRIVSLNLCTDSILFELVDRSRIASVTHLALDPQFSYFWDEVGSIPINHGLAEEVLILEPDLVLAGTYTAQPTTALLRSLGLPLVAIEPAESFDEFRAGFRAVAAAVDETARAERLLAELDARIGAVRPAGMAGRPRAVVFRPNAFTVGTRSLVTDVLAAAGFENLSVQLGLEQSSFLPIERLILAGPDLIVLADPEPEYPSLAHAVLGHRGIEVLLGGHALSRPRMSVVVPANLWTCGGSFLADAVERLAGARRALSREVGPR